MKDFLKVHEADGTDYRNAIEENWMYMGLTEWTITHRIGADDVHGFVINFSGIVASHGPVAVDAYAVRPVFYLKSDIIVKSGNGTKGTPYQIK